MVAPEAVTVEPAAVMVGEARAAVVKEAAAKAVAATAEG